MTDDEILTRAQALAEKAVKAKVRENQLNLALTHLKRSQDVGATLRLMSRLRDTPFAQRSKSTREQLDGLLGALRHALEGIRPWQEAATLLGWARRLMPWVRGEVEGG